MAKSKSEPDTTSDKKSSSGFSAAALRSRLAHLVWLVCVVCALLLAIGALLVALDATNANNALVTFIVDAADAVDLGVFDRTDGILKFDGENAKVKNVLVNWGIGAIVWLIIGRILDRLIRP